MTHWETLTVVDTSLVVVDSLPSLKILEGTLVLASSGLDATLLAQTLDLLSTALDGAGLEGLGGSRVAALREGSGTGASSSITGNDLPFHHVLIVLLARVGSSIASKGRKGELGESNHLERVNGIMESDRLNVV